MAMFPIAILGMAKFVLIIFALWLLVAGVFGVVRPERARQAIGIFASNNMVHFSELLLRICVGLSFIAMAEQLPYGLMFEIFGGFMVASAVVLMFLPRRWHHGFAQYWAENLPLVIVRMGAAFALCAGCLFILLIIGGQY